KSVTTHRLNRANGKAVANSCASVSRSFEITGQQRMDVDDAIGGAPNRAVKLSLFEHRHMAFRLLGSPQLHTDRQLTACLGVALQLLPALAASQEQRTVSSELNRYQIGRAHV